LRTEEETFMDATTDTPSAFSNGAYVARAFSDQHNLVLLGGAALFSLASASWKPLAAGAALEILWLAVAPFLPAFRRHVDVSASGGGTSESSAGGRSFELRLRKLEGAMRDIASLGRESAKSNGAEALGDLLGDLEALGPAFSRLHGLRQRWLRFLSDTSREALAAEATRLNQEFAAEKDLGVRLTLRQAATLAQRRVEQYDQIATISRTAQVRLDLMESSVAHVRARALSLAAPGELSAEVRGLLAQITSIAALEREASDVIPSERPVTLSSEPRST
jgi:hypothetical protein